MTRDAARPRAVYILCAGRTAMAGGIGRFVENLVRAMPLDTELACPRIVDTRGSGHILLAPFVFAAALCRIVLDAARGRIALLHVNLASRGSTLRKLVMVALGSALRLPIVIHLHGSRFDTFFRALPSWARAAVRWMFARADRVIVLGSHWQRFLIDEVGVAPGRIAVIANGVARPTIARTTPTAVAAPCVLFLGRLEARKGVPELLAALSSPVLSGRAWTAVLAGDGDVAAFAEQARLLGLWERVSFPGWLDAADVERRLAAAAMLVLPSHAEGLPMAVIEALAHRVAVVTTPVGAIPDFLAHGVSALFVPPGDAAALADAIAALLDDTAARERIAGAGHAAFGRHFEIEAVCQRMRDVYAQTLAHRSGAASPLSFSQGCSARERGGDGAQ
jgi:glycosyltransferase involved in cell wall biosynthesis